MNQAAQQISPSPAQRLADKIRARTNNGRDLIDLLHDIAQGGYDASNSDRVTASKYLFDRGYGKCPKQTPAPGPNPSPAPETEACPEPAEEGRGACPERKPVLSLPKGEGLPKSTAPFTIPSDLHQVRSPKGIRLHPQNLSTPFLSKITLSKSPTTARPSWTSSWT